MRMLILSDFHDAMDLNALSMTISNLSQLDLVISLGDITSDDLKMVMGLIPDVPIYGVCGNHDGPTVLDLAGVINIHGMVIEIDDIKIGGFGGSVRYKRGLYTMFSQKESLEIAKKLPEADILISHDRAFSGKKPKLSAPLAKDPHEGLAGITAYLRKTSPLLHIHGHIHDNRRYFFKGVDTISVYGGAIISIDANKVSDYRLLLEPGQGL